MNQTATLAEVLELVRQDQMDGAKVGRIILAGNSLSQPVRNEDDRKPVSFRSSASVGFRV